MERVSALNPNRRFYELDLLRFVAAIEVMMFHYTLYGFPHGQHPVDFTALGEALQYFYFGLEMLFMLSGFVILKTVQSKTALGFAAARAVRLYPTYWVCVTLTAVVLLLTNRGGLSLSLPQYLANLTMVQSAFGYEHLDGVYWTMEVQVVFYAWVFLICLMRQIRNADKFLGVWLLASVFVHVFGGVTFTDLDYLLLPNLSCYFIAGGAFFLIYQRGRSLYLWSVVVACYALSIRLALLDPRNGNPTAALVGNTLLFLLFARMVLHDHRLAGKPWMVILFKMTYPLYLIHQQVGYALFSRLRGFMPKYVLLVVVVSIMLLMSFVIFTQAEKWVAPSVRRASDRLLGLLGEVPPEPSARRAQAPAAAASKAAVARMGQPAIPPSAETAKQEIG
jgi:peptidoglycan/LPS O-acetylase OafA/YrhL